MKLLDAPPRTDADFLTYFKSEDSIDDHLTDPVNVSPFVSINFPMVSGFSVESMHTFYGGALKRRLKGLVHLPAEGKLNSQDLGKVDERLKLFEKCKPSEFDRFPRSLSKCIEKYKMHELRDFLMYHLFPVFIGILKDDQLENLLLLQLAMLLMGGFDPNPVPDSDITEASSTLKKYLKQLQDWGYPIRPTSHAMFHLPEDCKKFKCGVECLSAFLYENFYRFFRTSLRSGVKPLEQWRNRLVERSKYLRPTSIDGKVLDVEKLFQSELRQAELENSQQKIVLDFSIQKHRSAIPTKTLVFENFDFSNKFPNNVCMLNNSNIVVCTDIIEFPKNSNTFKIVGFKFLSVQDAFTAPFSSSRFDIHGVSKLNTVVSEWNIQNIACKMYAMPLKLSDYSSLPDITDPLSSVKWIVIPERHTYDVK